MRVTATRRLQYAIGHRIVRHESKCRYLHGHNFVFFLTAEGHALDELGRVIDFGALKELLGGWLEREWDHGLVLWAEDEEGKEAVRALTWQKVFYLPYNPTAENMARFVLEVVGPRVLPKGIRLVKVEVHETENGIATAELEG